MLENKLKENFIGKPFSEKLLSLFQIQNILLRKNITYQDFLSENKVEFDLNEDINADLLLIAPTNFNERYAFNLLIQVNRLALMQTQFDLDYIAVDQYSIKKNINVNKHEIFDDQHFLISSVTWPQNDYCYDDLSKVLIMDGKMRIIDIGDKTFKDFVKELSKQDPTIIEKLRPFMLNENFRIENQLTLNNILPVYPDIISIKLKLKNDEIPSLKQMKSNISTVFENQRNLDISWNSNNFNMVPLEPDPLNLIQKLLLKESIFEIFSKLQLELKMLIGKNKRILKEKNLKLPRIAIKIDPKYDNIDNNTIDTLIKSINDLISEILTFYRKFIQTTCTFNDSIKKNFMLLYDDLTSIDEAYELIAGIRLLESINFIEINVSSETKALKFEGFKKKLTLNCKFEGDGSLEYSNHEDVLIEILKLLSKEKLDEITSLRFSELEVTHESLNFDSLSSVKNIFGMSHSFDGLLTNFNLAKDIFLNVKKDRTLIKSRIVFRGDSNSIEDFSISFSDSIMILGINLSETRPEQYPDFVRIYELLSQNYVEDNIVHSLISISPKILHPNSSVIKLSEATTNTVKLPIDDIRGFIAKNPTAIRCFYLGLGNLKIYNLTFSLLDLNSKDDTKIFNLKESIPSQCYLLFYLIAENILMPRMISISPDQSSSLYADYQARNFIENRTRYIPNFISKSIEDHMKLQSLYKESIDLVIGKRFKLYRASIIS